MYGSKSGKLPTGVTIRGAVAWGDCQYFPFLSNTTPVLPWRSHAAGPLPVTSPYPSHRACLLEFGGCNGSRGTAASPLIGRALFARKLQPSSTFLDASNNSADPQKQQIAFLARSHEI